MEHGVILAILVLRALDHVLPVIDARIMRDEGTPFHARHVWIGAAMDQPPMPDQHSPRLRKRHGRLAEGCDLAINRRIKNEALGVFFPMIDPGARRTAG